MENLDKDRKFLTAGEVFTDDQIVPTLTKISGNL